MASETKFKETEIGMIPEDWNFGAFKEILTDGTKNGIYKQKEFHGHGSKIVNMGELFAYPRLYSVPMKRVNLTDNEINRFSLKENDLLFARRSLVAEGAGKCSIVREISEPTVFESSIIRARPNSEKANSLYLYYLFNSTYGLYLLDTIRRQVAVAGITGNDLQNLQIPLPPLAEQGAIANIISSLDDKIELNCQMNFTLEQIAQALFKRWFINFEFPDENGNPYKSSGGRMVDSELGEIPEGWEVKRLEKIAAINENSIKKDYPYDEIIYIDISSVDKGKLTETTKYDTKKAPSRAKRIVKNGDIIWSMVRPNRKSYLLVLDPQENLVVSTGFAVISPKVVPYSYLYFWVTTDSFVNYLSLSADGSAYPAVTADRFKEAKILVPKREQLSEFNTIISSLLIKLVLRFRSMFIKPDF